MDKKISMLAFAFVIAPFLLAACDDVTPPVTLDDESAKVTIIDEEKPDDDTPTETEETKTSDEVNAEAIVKDLVANQPAFFKNSDVKYTGVEEIDGEKILAPYKDEILNIHNEMYGSSEDNWDQISSFFQWYEVGEIVGGQYAGRQLLISRMACEGMCMYSTTYRFAYDADTEDLTALSAISGEVDPGAYADPLLDNEDEAAVISGVVLPDEITMPDGIHVLDKTMDDAGMLNPGYLQEVLFTDLNVGKVYGNNEGLGCVFVLKPDGTIAKYEYNPGFHDDDSLEIDWNDGSESTNVMNNYSYTHTGCGIEGNCYTVGTANMDILKEVGATTDGLKVYAVKDPVRGASKIDDGSVTSEQKSLDQHYNTYVSMAKYDETIGEPVGFDEFAAMNPILYWVDPIGRMSSIVHNDYKPMAECGKPVVYLYPEETMDVSVKVLIDEFTKTVPEHGDGWFVRSTPDSEIYNYADGETYPYLFWEGHKDGGMSLDQGFMVARDELEVFLPDVLSEMGLNDVEIADFIDFWYPIMTENSENYFFVSFVGTEDFNKVAPLEISPEPDTLIRVFMYYHPVNEPFAVQEQQLGSIPRNGFTVVEWGGTSSRPWVNQE